MPQAIGPLAGESEEDVTLEGLAEGVPTEGIERPRPGVDACLIGREQRRAEVVGGQVRES